MFEINLGVLSGVEYVHFFVYWFVFYGATILARVGTDYYTMYLEVLFISVMIVFPALHFGVLTIRM